MEFIAFLVPVFFILAAALTIAALVSIMRSQHLEQTSRIIWVVVVLMLPTLGAIAWFIARPTQPTPPQR